MTKLNRQAYEKLIKEDIAYLDIYAKPSIERDHIKQVLVDSVTLLYDMNILKDDTADRSVWGLDDVIDLNEQHMIDRLNKYEDPFYRH